MKKYLNIFTIFIFICCFYSGSSYGETKTTSAFEECMKRILAIDDNKNGKSDFAEELDKLLGNPNDIESFASAANSKANVIAVAITGAAFHKDSGSCNDLIMQIANEPKESFSFALKKFDRTVQFKITKKKLLEQYKVALGILIANTATWQYPKVIDRDYISEKTWDNDCSDYLSANPFDSVYDSDPVNIAMQKIKGDEEEYFIDEPEHMHAFQD